MIYILLLYAFYINIYHDVKDARINFLYICLIQPPIDAYESFIPFMEKENFTDDQHVNYNNPKLEKAKRKRVNDFIEQKIEKYHKVIEEFEGKTFIDTLKMLDLEKTVFLMNEKQIYRTICAFTMFAIKPPVSPINGACKKQNYSFTQISIFDISNNIENKNNNSESNNNENKYNNNVNKYNNNENQYNNNENNKNINENKNNINENNNSKANEQNENVGNIRGKDKGDYIKLDCNCDIFKGVRKNRAKIAHLVQFGFEADVLEIHLNEVFDEIDKFFIVELERCHFMNSPKPPIFPLLAKQARFKKFLSKIVYIFIPDEYLRTKSEFFNKNLEDKYRRKTFPGVNIPSDKFYNEKLQERLRWELFLEWNKKNKDYFGDDDVIGFGDTDEIPSYLNLAKIKQCEMKGTTDIGIWFTFGQINKYYSSDFSIKNFPTNTLGDPTFWTLREAKRTFEESNRGNVPSRNRGRSDYALAGGLHLTSYRYLPFLLLKDFTMTESSSSGWLKGSIKAGLRMNISIEEIIHNINRDYEFENNRNNKYHNLDKKLIGSQPFILPWFLECNLRRYSSFLEEPYPDERIK